MFSFPHGGSLFDVKVEGILELGCIDRKLFLHRCCRPQVFVAGKWSDVWLNMGVPPPRSRLEYKDNELNTSGQCRLDKT